MDDHVFIKQIQGETSKVDVESMTQFTIERLMNEVAEKCGIELSRQRLIFRGKEIQLSPQLTLAEAQIKSGDQVIVVARTGKVGIGASIQRLKNSVRADIAEKTLLLLRRILLNVATHPDDPQFGVLNASSSTFRLCFGDITARALLVEAGFRATRINGQDKFQFHVFHAGRATLSKDELKGVETTVSIVENSIDRNALHADDEKQARTKAKQRSSFIDHNNNSSSDNKSSNKNNDNAIRTASDINTPSTSSPPSAAPPTKSHNNQTGVKNKKLARTAKKEINETTERRAREQAQKDLEEYRARHRIASSQPYLKNGQQKQDREQDQPRRPATRPYNPNVMSSRTDVHPGVSQMPSQERHRGADGPAKVLLPAAAALGVGVLFHYYPAAGVAAGILALLYFVP